MSPKNGLSTDANFETGIAKIQSESEQTVTQAEKHACKAFQKDANLGDESDLTVDSDKEDIFLREFEKAKDKRQKNQAARVTILTATSS